MATRLASLALALLLTACGGSSNVVRDGAPNINPDRLLRVPDAVPRPVNVTRAGNKNPYTVLGKTYHLLSESEGYKARGTASWYGTKFHGRRTANGEVYDMNAMTAAHKTLPIPCYVRVTNRANQRSVVVRVNDRGPFHGNRLIDLSYAAAVKLDFHNKGTAEVDIEVVSAGQKPGKPGSAARPTPVRSVPVVEAKAKAALKTSAEAARGISSAAKVPVLETADSSPVADRAERPLAGGFFLQAGAFTQQQPAITLQKQLQYITNLDVHIASTQQETPKVYRVRIGPTENRAALEKLQAEMLAVDLGNPFIGSIK